MAPSSSSSASTSVQVALRIRPPTNQDSTSIPARFQRSVIQATSGNSVSIETSSSAPSGAGASASASVTSSGSAAKKQSFSFDQVHSPSTTQHALFTTTAEPLVSRFIEGFNCTILAYGQTSSGKTFTMTGIDLDADPSDPNNGMGIIPRAVSTMFARGKQLKEERGGAWNFSVKGSFIEIYNEDLIDLLSSDDATGGRREVQIREDKDGHIIWGGLREVSVKNPSEVMTLLRKGTSIRRTNETDMNAQSSRSHAIFSLTLTQKKFVGTGAPPRSSSPLPPNGRSPSRLARPGSMYSGPASPTNTSRMASPTFGRPSTPSFASAMGRGGGGLRPASSLGLHTASASLGGDDESGEWVTIVSKFHFVDLAGSERLKRTAAAGERIKEGISINSGLLALGNVISALGDPARAKSHTATHIPYRDSKLTRLLQDSLGGNAHTLMIACVSPAEWNAGETINTLKYANRARNIKNRAVVNEKEDGWDDVEWLQGTVGRLRKELKGLKDNGIISVASLETEASEGSTGKRVLAQMTELQNNYEDLREKFVERTEELTRLRRELGEKQRGSTAGAIGGTAKYEEIVGPVIEEYEKTIAAMEAELNLNRAALRMTNEMVEEKEEELAVITERHAATELYVEELRARTAKLTEREASTEAYVRDLEEKMKSHDENSITSSESMLDLKREVTRFRDTETRSTKYIADLEARLAKSDESVLDLQQTIERLEKDSDRRREEVLLLQERLTSLANDGDSWRSDLEARERKVKELELKMEEWERKKTEAGETRSRLGGVVGEVALARRSLQVDLDSAPTFPSEPPSPINLESPNSQAASLSRSASPGVPNGQTESQLVALQQTHTATLADLASVTSKYRDALREISDLAGQIQEAKLSNTESTPIDEKPVEIPPFGRRLTGSRSRELSESQVNPAGRRLFFRQAASAESLHSRSLSQSQSLSQELSSARSRKASSSSHGTSSSVSHSAHSPSNSLSPNSPVISTHRPNLSISTPQASKTPSLNGTSERSVVSLETEIMRLQDVLKEREAEITSLELSLKNSSQSRVILNGTPLLEEIEDAEVNGDSQTAQHDHLSPKTLNQFDNIRKSMENGHTGTDPLENASEIGGSVSEPDESLDRLNELMLSMAQKESYHREVVDDLNSQLTQVRRQHDALTTLSRDQAVNMSTEIEGLQSKHAEDLAKLQVVQEHEAELVEALQRAATNHAAAVEQLRTEHTDALQVKASEVETLVSQLKQEHAAHLTSELAKAAFTLEKSQKEHEDAFGKLKAAHENELRRQLKEVHDLLETTREASESTLTKTVSEHEETLRQKEAAAAADVQRIEEEYYNALTKLRENHADAISKQLAESLASQERLREEHAGELRIAEISREGSLSESASSRDVALRDLQEEHASSLSRKEASFTEQLESLKTEHARALSTKDDDYQLQLDKLRTQHEGVLARLKEERRVEVEALNSSSATIKNEAISAASAAQRASDNALETLREQQASVLQEVTRGHEEDVAALRSSHETALHDTILKADQERELLIQSHTEEILKLNTMHQQAITNLNAALVAAEQQHLEALEHARVQNEHRLAETHSGFEATLSDLRSQHDAAVDTMSKDRELIIQELETHKSVAEDMAAAREEVRQAHSEEVTRHSAIVRDMQEELSGVHTERESLRAQLSKLRHELDSTRSEQSKLIQEASKRESLVVELERHRSELAEMHESLEKVKDEKDSLQVEKIRQESMVRELQAQIARSSSPPGMRGTPDRNMSYTRATGLPAMKLPPPTPPPSVPPPPAPRATHHMNMENGVSTSSQASSGVLSSSSSRESTLDSPSTSTGGFTNGASSNDPQMTLKVEQQAKHIDEQDVMIKTLNKQLTHCESDLQTHMDLVSTLETSLGDSEKNLRKARMHATEIARERDVLNSKLEALRNELTDAKREVVTVRRSIVEEKQSLEQRLDEERKAKERARAQLDTRMEELQKRKSKFACL